MQHRGRSRHVSPVALARQASEERRHAILEHQMHIAYAHDNIRLANTLLLALKGIHVTSDADPRIDQVRDQDFDPYFATDGADTRSQWWHESLRARRLRACEKLWEVEKARLHDQKCRALQRREQDAEQQRARPADPSSRLDPLPVTKRDLDPFQYAFMPPCKPSACRPPKLAKKASAARSVSFKEVISAMNGKLFPLDPCERADDARRIAGVPIAGATAHKRKASVRADLLDSLLQVVEWQQDERRKAKGKDVDRSRRPLKPSHPTPTLSVPSSPSAASVSSSPSRSSSWLSFGSWRSTATDITTPDSPVLLSPTSQPCLLPTLTESQRDLTPRCAFVRISPEDSPLCAPVIPLPLQGDQSCVPPSATPTEIFSSMAIVKRVTRSVATIVEAAKGFQSAYISATAFTAGHPYRDADAHPRQPPRCQRQVRCQGYRALAKDVRKFTDLTSSISQTCEPVHFIPLVSPPSASAGIAKPPAPKDAVLFPSPLRPRTPPVALAYRMRPVANPAVLRLRALQNLMDARGKEWEGRGREGGLGCGKERMLGIAFEGRGRSGLGCEVRFVVA